MKNRRSDGYLSQLVPWPVVLKPLYSIYGETFLDMQAVFQ